MLTFVTSGTVANFATVARGAAVLLQDGENVLEEVEL
jgi:hypothetical protein